jgi:CHAT domain-containing protein
LLLTPPDKKSEPNPKDDGMLYLHEIYSLPLKDCELSVLSACLTNVAYQKQALEAGVTIASGFLCAGSRNVVASNWSVDDRSTVELMDFFFQEVNKSIQKGEKVDYAFALQTARKKVRALPGYSSPYFWAPFVIIGQVK